MSIVIAGRLALGLVGVLPTVNNKAAANDFTAEKVMKDMKPAERYPFVAGIVEGLAVARYFKDGKKMNGMECIYDWFYDDKQTIDTVYAAFGRFPTYPPGSIIYSLTRQKCGE